MGKTAKNKYISLKEAAKISGYASDYIGYLIREGEIKGKKVYGNSAWFVNKKDILAYKKKKHGKGRNLIYDIFPPIQEKVSAWIRAFQVFLKTSKYSVIFIISGIALAIGSYYLINFLNLSVKAQEQIKIFPTAFSGNWQNPEAALFQDLGENATFEEFNKENSAHPLEILEVLPEETITPTSPIEAPPIETPSVEGAVSPVEELLEEETQTPSSEIPQSGEVENQNLEESNQENLEQREEIVPEEQGETPETSSFWNKVKNFFGGKARAQEEAEEIIEGEQEEAKQGEEQTMPLAKVLELSNFSVGEGFEGRPIKNVELRFSLAAKGNSNGNLAIEYYYKENWQVLASFNLENEISNALNGGYFLYALPIFESWQEVDNLKIKIRYLQQGADEQQVYLDGVWLEVEYEEEEPQAEEPLLAEDDFDSRRAGVLYSQGTWNGTMSGKNWVVVDSSSCPPGSPSGGNCLSLECDATAEFENTIDTKNPAILPYRNNLVSFYFYSNWQGEPTVGFNLYWRSPTDEVEQVRLDFNTQEGDFFYIFLSNGETDAAVFDLPLKQWHKIEVNIDKESRQARFRVNDKDWTNFVSWVNPRESIGLLRLRGMVEREANFYLDDLSVSEFIP